MDKISNQVLVCTGGGCIASGALEVSAAFSKELADMGIAQNTQVIETGCLGPCAVGPVVLIYPDGVFYQNVHIEDVHEICEEHLLKGRIVDRLVSHAPGTDRSVAEMQDVEFFNRQVKIVLRNSGVIDPLKIEEYIAREGYQALAKVLTEMEPADVVSEVLRSGLRGRGGAGFPTGLKWKFARQTESDVKYILCNADEDRSVLEGDPHSLIEGMAIGAHAIGAKEGFVYLRAEYPLAIERLQYAIDQARELGLLGKNILGTDFEFDLEIRMGSGAFVCGEETALMRSIEGGRGEPRPRPPFPAVKGLWDKPSVLNNVETFANIAPIILKGAEWYASTGTEKSKGTKVFALGGAIQHAGLVEGASPAAKSSRPCSSADRPAAAYPRAISTSPWTTRPCRSWAPSWAPGAASSWTTTRAWWTWPASSWTSSRTRAAASARPAAWGPSACSRWSPASATVRAKKATSRPSRTWATSSRTRRCAASARRRPTRCFPPSATSGTSMKPTSRTTTAKPASAPPCSQPAAATPARRR
jgi:(2Fe-2S) ferredoxin